MRQDGHGSLFGTGRVRGVAKHEAPPHISYFFTGTSSNFTQSFTFIKISLTVMYDPGEHTNYILLRDMGNVCGLLLIDTSGL